MTRHAPKSEDSESLHIDTDSEIALSEDKVFLIARDYMRAHVKQHHWKEVKKLPFREKNRFFDMVWQQCKGKIMDRYTISLEHFHSDKSTPAERAVTAILSAYMQDYCNARFYKQESITISPALFFAFSGRQHSTEKHKEKVKQSAHIEDIHLAGYTPRYDLSFDEKFPPEDVSLLEGADAFPSYKEFSDETVGPKTPYAFDFSALNQEVYHTPLEDFAFLKLIAPQEAYLHCLQLARDIMHDNSLFTNLGLSEKQRLSISYALTKYIYTQEASYLDAVNTRT